MLDYETLFNLIKILPHAKNEVEVASIKSSMVEMRSICEAV
jgi:hypothetical protein